MADEKVLYEVKDKIAWITLNRPESLNAVNRDMVKSIVGYCREAEEDPNVQVVIFKANGERAFSVGGDIKDRARLNAAWRLNRRSRRWCCVKRSTRDPRHACAGYRGDQ